MSDYYIIIDPNYSIYCRTCSLTEDRKQRSSFYFDTVWMEGYIRIHFCLFYIIGMLTEGQSSQEGWTVLSWLLLP